MSVKIYLSPAAHGHDNPCSYDRKNCGENTHANLYLDELIPYLDACGFEWKRNPKSNTGSAGVQKAVQESNSWKADLHYVVHTNASDGTVRGSRPMVYPYGSGKQWAEVIKSWREKIYPNPVIIKMNSELYEITHTSAVCVYEELVFHDNPEDVTWFHENMRLLAEYTARAFCEIFKVEFKDPYLVVGDADGDGKVTTTDARLVLQHSAGKIDDSDINLNSSDVDGDGKVTTTDARLILQHSAGKIDEFPAEKATK